MTDEVATRQPSATVVGPSYESRGDSAEHKSRDNGLPRLPRLPRLPDGGLRRCPSCLTYMRASAEKCRKRACGEPLQDVVIDWEAVIEAHARLPHGAFLVYLRRTALPAPVIGSGA